jgi:5'-nucleotidase
MLMATPHILVTNDDGIHARGLQVLEQSLRETGLYRLTVVAPSDQQSASSHSLTLTTPVRVLDVGEGRYAVTGTPTDCVLVAVEHILRDDRPDFVVSGINHGPNMGEDVTYSGTVAAAMEGAILGIPSLALSLAAWHPRDWSGAAAFVRERLPAILARPLGPGALLNINFPERPAAEWLGVRVARLGSRVYHDVITQQVDPRGRPFLWISGQGPTWVADPRTDFALSQQGYVVVTPLKIDLTHHELLPRLAGLEFDGPPGVAEAPPDGAPLDRPASGPAADAGGGAPRRSREARP